MVLCYLKFTEILCGKMVSKVFGCPWESIGVPFSHLAVILYSGASKGISQICTLKARFKVLEPSE